MVELSTDYLGMELDHPLVVSACQPLSEDVSHVRQLEDAGAAAVVLHSLFEEQIVEDSMALDHYLSYGEESFAEALDYFPEMNSYNVGPEEYLNLVSDASDAVDIPIIGSLNGVSEGGWIEYANKIEQAGADALELNIYYIPTDPEMTGDAVEYRYEDVLAAVKNEVDIPLALKIGPFFSSIPHAARRFEKGGADALVLFNRFYQPDFNIEELEVEADLQLSRSYDMRLPLRWIAILHQKIDVDFAITSGVHTHRDVLKAMMGGASIAMMASELLKEGVERLGEIRRNLIDWMVEFEYRSIRQMQGSMSHENLEEEDALERANYTKTIHSYKPEPTGRSHIPTEEE
jgi:dihydroorotate dehydrogenase (fumarate)